MLLATLSREINVLGRLLQCRSPVCLGRLMYPGDVSLSFNIETDNLKQRLGALVIGSRVDLMFANLSIVNVKNCHFIEWTTCNIHWETVKDVPHI